MKLPTVYDDNILCHDDRIAPDGSTVPTAVYSVVYPPIGFFPFYDIGNGDYHGLYWPIGKEEEPPLVAFSSHDAWSLIPEYSDMEAFYACSLARAADEDDSYSLVSYRELVKTATGRPPVEHDLRGLAADDYEQLLSLDSTSPFYLCAAGDIHLGGNDVEAAEQKYRAALDVLPEYVAAHFGLASVLRRQRRLEEATVHLRLTLIGPMSFYGGSFWSDTALPGNFRNDWSRKAVMWIQRSKTLHESLVDDPFATRINELTFETGLAENADIDVLRLIVESYAASGSFADAARIWMLIGERAAMETTSFRERYDLTPTTYGGRLAELLELSGNERRAALVRNMLGAMKKPAGLYL
ncbi:tetratricopeptide repeat protein [Blastopirellula retiformator]|uniref:Tetratricopeptide repeat protein n=1 Tax=Blastopirellula retiformator TaxID=2527970 RepID=A0A5C5VJT9_9BACT|nr:tetratricopeptide repeat protein [Blastopirellula retiformator]TWT38876.1 hypothetical protein Enr8_05700 [Blastopirellula retiformator]